MPENQRTAVCNSAPIEETKGEHWLSSGEENQSTRLWNSTSAKCQGNRETEYNIIERDCEHVLVLVETPCDP